MSGPAPPPATGAAIMEQLIQLQAKLDQFAREAHDHWDGEERRYELVDKFIDPALHLDGLLKQVFSVLRQDHEAVLALEREVRRLSGAIELAIATGSIDSAANGQHTTDKPQ